MHKLTLSSLTAACLLLAACIKPIDPVPYPTPYPTPSDTPTPTATPDPSLGPLQVVELANGNLVSDSFKLEFGPGSKGVKLEFGPGSKGTKLEFGPGTKGPKNMEFNIELPQALTNPEIEPFAVAQLAVGGALFLNQLKVEFIRDNQLYATASILPRRQTLEVDAKFHPGSYAIQVVAQTVKGPLQMSWSKLEILPDYKASLKVEVFADPNKTTKPEDLDVEILTQNRDEKLVLVESSPSPGESPAPDPAESASPSPQTSSEPSPVPSPEPTFVSGTINGSGLSSAQTGASAQPSSEP
ncbi:MAG: hypothetical protein ACAI44_23125 [Candidatus Sericytochromatia bacterium]